MSTNSDGNANVSSRESLVETLLPPLIMAKLLPDQTVLLLLFVLIVIVATLVILKLTVKCFSSSGSALISPTKKSKKRGGQNGASVSMNPPKSPYATLRRPEHKPSAQLSNFIQATRGRILNYDFEQDGPTVSGENPAEFNTRTLKHNRDHKHETKPQFSTMGRPGKSMSQRERADDSEQLGNSKKMPIQFKSIRKGSDGKTDSLVELNDNISVSQLDTSERDRSENNPLTIPGPPQTQPPPYMMASTMKGHGSAIAAAAAAVANKRMQRDNIEQPSRGKVVESGNPVYL